MDLPRFILLKSNANNKFLCYTEEKDTHSFLRFSYQAKHPQQEKKADDDDESDKIGFHHLKFEVEKAKSVEGLVHIRSCYNNKYWARKSVDNKYMAAVANEAEEDQSKWSCTLFKPIFLDDNTRDDADLLPLCKSYKIRLVHVSESGQHSVRSTSKLASDDDDSVLDLAVGDNVAAATSGDSTAFTAFDVEASAILPEYATFMGHNDNYATRSDDSLSTLAFSATDIGARYVANKVPPTALPQPTSIYNTDSEAFWARILPRGTSIMVDPTQITPCTSFVPIKIGDHIALKCVDLFIDKFVTCDCDNGHALMATATGIDDYSMLRVGEPVRVREITDATYDLADSRIYGTNSVEKFSDTRSNHTSVEQEGTFQVEYKTSQTKTWSNSTTVNIGVSVSWSAGIPYVGELGVDISYEHDQTWEWGEEQTEEKTITYSQTIKIPPGKKVTLKVVAQKAYCDVPFTCKVRDLMTDGNIREYTKNDGLYSGCNEFQFDSDIIEEDV